VLLAAAADGLDELHVDLDSVSGERLLVALPAGLVTLVALRARQAVHLEALEDPPDTGVADLDVVVAVQVHGDLQWPEVVVLAQVDDLADHFRLGCVR
jgi:hypothetical protein